MRHSPLKGLSILVVEDQPLIAVDIVQQFEPTGAHITMANTLQHAMILAENEGLSAAILDHVLSDGDSATLYCSLAKRGIPFLIYSGYPSIEGLPDGVPLITKPSAPGKLVAAVEELVRMRPRYFCDLR